MEIDLAEILFTLFWVFFVGLIYYLRREDKREGYPLVSDRDRHRVRVQGFPAVPKPKEFALPHGGTQLAPFDREEREVAATPAARYPGAPLLPTGNPMIDGVGPASYAERSDQPELTFDGEPRIVPMRIDDEFSISKHDADPRGMTVVAADRAAVGKVTDAWVDRSEPQIFFLEIELDDDPVGGTLLAPLSFVDILSGKRQVLVNALYSHQFRTVPRLKSANSITPLEEDKICGYYAGGLFYGDQSRQEAVL